MILIVQSLWNQSITDKLVSGAKESLLKSSLEFELVQVPGAMEIPLAVRFAIEREARGGAKVEGVVTCGAIIKGDTYHFELVADESGRLLSQLSLDFKIPIGHGILAVYSLDQAIERAGGKHGNKGIEATEAVIKMLSVKKHFLQ